VITPAVAVGTDAIGFVESVAPALKTTGFGVLKFVWLKTLNTSARNSSAARSVIGNLFDTDRSVAARPGPFRKFRDALPHVPASGVMKASGLKYRFGSPRINLAVKFGFSDGRTGLRVSPSFDGL
jgi:hypothetical protein